MQIELENKHLILIAIVIVLLYLFYFNNNNEGLDNVKKNGATYNPRAFQPFIQEQVTDYNFVEVPKEAEYPWAQNPGNYGEVDILDDGAKGNMGLNFAMCSKSCCAPSYPPPFAVNGPDDFVLMSGENFVPSGGLSCNNGWQDSGCLCMTKDQALFLNRRGNNSYTNV